MEQLGTQIAVEDDNIQVVPAANSLNFLGGLDVADGGQGKANISLGSHRTTHQDGGTDELNVTNLSGVLADAQKVAVQDEGNPVATHTQLNFTGPGVIVSDDAANNRINIDISGGTGARIFTGELKVEIGAGGGVQPVTVLVEELNDREPFAVVLAPQLPAATNPIFLPPLNRVRPGNHFIFGSTPNFTRIFVAFVPQPYNRTFEIHGFAPEFAPIEGPPLTMVVAYWVIAGAQQVIPRILRDRIVDVIRNNPSVTSVRLAEELRMDRAELEPELDRLIEEGVIRRGPGGRLTLVES
ncbi:MAG: MarR family winged helix-turn-helix transcriptional regulator, partial [Nitrospira sp.]|nr:MarR family winged helix-turn-helix transcriptional regulator [Nitrospira sp.]